MTNFWLGDTLQSEDTHCPEHRNTDLAFFNMKIPTQCYVLPPHKNIGGEREIKKKMFVSSFHFSSQVLDETGNQDLCFYNFWCAHPLGPLTDFNHVFSNISYILFGILFIAICARRNHHHKLAAKLDYKIDKVRLLAQFLFSGKES